MKSFQIFNGDLVIGAGGHLAFADLQQKLVQDLSIWVKSEYGVLYTAPSWGSKLPSYIGSASPTNMLPAVQAEMQRLLGLYQQQQANLLYKAQSANQLSAWAKSQIIQSVDSITCTAQATTITVQVVIITLANSQIPINLSVSPSGVSLTS